MITVVVPTIPSRAALLDRALASIHRQTFRDYEVIAIADTERDGAPITRQRGLDKVTTEWTAFLDDDDEFLPGHLSALYAAAMTEQADFVFSWYEVVGGTDPRAAEFGLPWDPEHPRQTTITTLVRTDLAQSVGGFIDPDDLPLSAPGRKYAGEDWLFTRRINEVGRIFHLPERTWRWHHHSGNTSGLPSRA